MEIRNKREATIMDALIKRYPGVPPDALILLWRIADEPDEIIRLSEDKNRSN
jgi:hypothetical protein